VVVAQVVSSVFLEKLHFHKISSSVFFVGSCGGGGLIEFNVILVVFENFKNLNQKFEYLN